MNTNYTNNLKAYMGGPPAPSDSNGGREFRSLPPFRPLLGQREALPPISLIRGICGLLLS